MNNNQVNNQNISNNGEMINQNTINNNNQTNVNGNHINPNPVEVNVSVNQNSGKEKVNVTRYKYKVRTKEGKVIEDVLDAVSKMEVENFLASQQYEILQINEEKLSNTVIGLGNLARRMSNKDLNFFLTQLSTYIKAGIPLTESMQILSRQNKKKSRKILYSKIVYELNRGVTFSNALAKQGNVFPKMLINMLRTSELTGNLTEVLDEMAIYYKRADSNAKQIKNAMTYPSVLLVFALAVLTFVILWVVPSFTSMYDATGADLPAITKTVMNISSFLDKNILFIVLGLIVFVIIMVLLYKNVYSVKYGIQWLILHIPVVSDIVKYNQIVMFTSTFATLIKHDVFITDSMDILGKISNNEIYRQIIDNAINNLSNGVGLSKAFEGHWAFPDVAYEMLVTGEKTGRLGPMMEQVANYYQEEQTNIVTRLKSLIEPLMIILLAVIVGVVLLSVVYPMFDIYKNII